MDKNRKLIGYALGGGAARGLFHIGALNVLEEYGIFPDYISGTSMGAIIGALYASGLSSKEISQIAHSIDWKRIIRLADITLPVSGLIQERRINALLKSVIEDLQFSQLKRNFCCVATDMYSGEQIVFNEGSLLEAIRASISVPGIFKPVISRGRYLVDGGLVNVVPVSVCREMGAEFIIGINVIPDPSSEVMNVKIGASSKIKRDHDTELEDEMQKPIIPESKVHYHSRIQKINSGISKFLLYKQPRLQRLVSRSTSFPFIKPANFISSGEPGLVDVLSQSLNIVEYNIAMENLRGADLIINPASHTVGIWEFHRAAEAISGGEKATRLALQKDVVARLLLDKTSG